MSNEKISRTFRLNSDVVDMILELQNVYSEHLGVKISQADVISLVIRNEYEQIEK